MKIFFLTLALFFFVKGSFAQHSYIDSLKYNLRNAKDDTNKVWIYESLGGHYQWSYPDSALLYATPGLQLAKRLNFVNGQLATMWVIAEALGAKGNYSQELQISLQRLKIAEKTNNAGHIAAALAEIGNSYYYSGDYKNALTYYYKSKSVGIFDNDRGQEIIITFIGETYFHLNNLDSALLYTRKAYNLEVQKKRHWPVPYFYMGKIYEKKGVFNQAIYYFKTGVNNSYQNLDKADGFNNLAGIYKKKGDADSSIFYAGKALAVSLKYSFPSQVIDASGTLTSLYKSKHLPDSALKYQDMMLAAKDSVFSKEKIKQMQNFSFDEQIRQQEILAREEQYRNSVKLHGLLGVVAICIVIAIILWRNNRSKQKANEEIQKALSKLKTTQTQLIQFEKMASLGELTAGIAHEIQNPLNFVNNFSEVNTELIDEMQQGIDKGDLAEVKAIANDIKDNQQKISQHGKRADFIVKGMLQHSRTGTGDRQLTNINLMADEFFKLSFHGLRARDKSFNAEMITDFDENLPKINVVQQDIGRVLLNLFNNAFYAVNQKAKTAGADYKPEVVVTTAIQPPPEGGGAKAIVIRVKDNGIGIPDNIKEKIMQPFFTTKPTGEGTGLGLSLTYDMVVKGHGGSINVESKEGAFTIFTIGLPII